MIELSVAKRRVFFRQKAKFLSEKSKKKKVFVESLDQFRRLEVCEKVRIVFVMRLRLSDHKALHNIASSSSFFDFTWVFWFFFARISYVQTFGIKGI